MLHDWQSRWYPNLTGSYTHFFPKVYIDTDNITESLPFFLKSWAIPTFFNIPNE